MSDVLIRIKRAVLAGQYAFSEKARSELEADCLTELDVAESILNAVAIYKRIRSRSLFRPETREYLYIVQATNLDGVPIYSKVSWSARRPVMFTTFLSRQSDRLID